MERLKHMKECLMGAVESQMYNLQHVDTKELGEAIDMIKDISEAIYYCTITEAMKEKEEEYEKKTEMHFHEAPVMYYDRRADRDNDGRYNEGKNYSDGRMNYPMYYSGSNSSGNGNQGGNSSQSNDSRSNYSEEMRDYREGRSPRSRRMYMEAKERKSDKATQLRELEKYMQELTQDMVEMIENASPEEKQYLEKKMTALASKIAQLK